jgi:glycosyltransferase involved in cell wall biosynthesis
MSNTDYLDAFESADILLLPYDPELYRGRGSGVFSEAIGYGKVVVAPQSAGVGEEIEAGNGAGVLFRDHHAAAVAAAVNEAVRRAPELTRLARRGAERWREKHSGTGYLTVINELIA